MLFVELTIEMQINGLLAFIHNILAIILAILVFTKAIKSKKGMLYVFSLFMLFSAAGYYQIGLNYIYWVFTQGNLFPYEVSVLVGTAGIGIATWAWIYIYFKMLFAKKTKVAVILYGIFVVIFYAYLLFFLFFAPGAPVVEMIGEVIFPYEVRYTGFVLISFLASLVITTITTFHLGIYLMKRETRENKWKGRFLVMGMAIITVSVFIDMAVADIIFIIVIVRILGIIAMLFIYFGFILPNWMRRALNLELKQA